MYTAFFDLREKPFKLVPNPEFLFLGKCHEEALAHLAYATSQGDGFAEITGEVGTGKTTLCRVFLEDLDPDVEAAFIFNSKLDSTQLLKAIHKELGILSIANGPAELTQDLNDYLLEKKSNGKSVILLIDEAQNLGKETLEQLRMLSNLETTRSKLLQIILVGQPELREILDSHEMRQLRQRINVSCHIHPMTQKETFDYIAHRVNVACRKPKTLFTPSAQKAIYRFARGVPRLINMACDRSLLVAYSLNRKKVTSASVKIALDELDMRPKNQPLPGSVLRKTAMVFFFIIFIGCLLFYLNMGTPLEWRGKIKVSENAVTLPSESNLSAASLDSLKKAAPPLVETEQEAPEPVLPRMSLIEKGEVQSILSEIKKTATRETAFIHIASLWMNESMVRLNPLVQQIESNDQFFKIAAAQNNFHMLYLKESLDAVEKFNLPVIIGYELPGDPVKGFLGIESISADNTYILFPVLGGKKYKIDPADVIPFLTGDMYIAWKNNFGYDRVITKASSKDSIISLKLLLTEIGFSLADMTPAYDNSVKQAIKQIQKKYGLVEDGLVGPLTKIVLFNEKKVTSVPYLNSARIEIDQ